MSTAEPAATALLVAVVGLLVTASVLLSRGTRRFGVPIFLVFLAIGMLAGSDGIGGIDFDDYGLALRLGTVALALILFDGGLNTRVATIRVALAPAGLLATVGVLATSGLVAMAAFLLGLPRGEALLLGAVVGSTDAAAVFSVLRGSGLRLRRRVGGILELESGLNDPLAVLLTMSLTAGLVQGEGLSLALLWQVPVQLAVGAVLGVAIGAVGRFMLLRVELQAAGLYATLMFAIAMLAFALPTLAYGSGFLAVYVAGVTLGAGKLPYRAGLLRLHDSVAWICQVGMFVLLGLLVNPSRLGEVAGIGLALGLVLAFVARPLAVVACLAPLRLPAREVAFLGWVGLRGAVPIILATYPVVAGVSSGERLFHVVFFIVVVNALVPGATVGWLTRRLGLESSDPPPAQAVLEIASHRELDGEVRSYRIAPPLPACGARIVDLAFPEGSTLMLIVRGRELVAPRGHTVLEAGDHVYVFSRDADLPLLTLLFGAEEES